MKPTHFYDFDKVDNDFDNLFPFEYEYIYDEIPILNSSGLIDYEVYSLIIKISLD